MTLCIFFPLVIALFAGALSAKERVGDDLSAEVIASPKKTFNVTQIELFGHTRTNKEWLIEYLDIKLPRRMTVEDADRFRRKLLTTIVYTSIQTSFRQDLKHPDKYTLVFELDEKFTTVPVARFAYGGGTPLRVLGVYDTHSFGRLWTLGLETRKYGSAPVGAVVWARAPRWLTGQHAIGIELWRDYRIRQIYNEQDESIGSFSTEHKTVRGTALAPIHFSNDKNTNWQAGIDAQVRRVAPSSFDVDPNFSGEALALVPKDIDVGSDADLQSSIMANLILDDIDVDNIEMHGSRFLFRAGPAVALEKTYGQFENEGFHYQLFPNHWNSAFHYFVGQVGTQSILNQYFLGGFDSVRGIPDGALYGSKAFYFNAELRKISHQWKYLWVQEAFFIDAGGAGQTWSELYESRRGSSGIGVRLAIPQIYRMVIRIDYAWSLDHPGTQGLSAGINELFQPYKPL